MNPTTLLIPGCATNEASKASWKEVSWEGLRDTEKGEILRISLAKGEPRFLPRARNLGKNILESLLWRQETKKERFLGLMSTAEFQADFNGHRWFWLLPIPIASSIYPLLSAPNKSLLFRFLCRAVSKVLGIYLVIKDHSSSSSHRTDDWMVNVCLKEQIL